MGCDIHVYVEYKHNDGHWNADDRHRVIEEDEHYSYIEEFSAGGRHYGFFGALAGVRSSAVGPLYEPRGIPEDLSDIVQKAIDNWSSDGHTHSYLSLDEYKEVIDNFNKKIDERFPDDLSAKITEDDGYFYLYKDCLRKIEKHNAEAILLDAPHLKIKECRIVFFFDN